MTNDNDSDDDYQLMHRATIPGLLDSTVFLENQLNDKQLKRSEK